MLEFINNLSLIQWILGLITLVIVPTAIYLWKYFNLQMRFAKNLRRKIYFLKVNENKNLESEQCLIRNTKLFRVENEIYSISNDLKILQQTDKHSLFVIGYDPSYQMYAEIIDIAKRFNLSVIIFAKQGEIKNPQHWELFNSYIYCDVANTSSRLAVIILNTMYIL